MAEEAETDSCFRHLNTYCCCSAKDESLHIGWLHTFCSILAMIHLSPMIFGPTTEIAGDSQTDRQISNAVWLFQWITIISTIIFTFITYFFILLTFPSIYLMRGLTLNLVRFLVAEFGMFIALHSMVGFILSFGIFQISRRVMRHIISRIYGTYS